MTHFRASLTFLLFAMGSSFAEEHRHGTSGGRGLFEPFKHTHRSELGTPIVHSFGVEPALTGRDLFIDYRFRNGSEFEGHEIATELEWAFTQRLGLILELPFLFEDGGDGFGDLALVPRMTLLEWERFLLTAQIEVVAPTGTNGFGGETAIAPGISTWIDLGNHWTLNSQFAVEHIFDEGVDELLFGFGLVKSIGQPSEDAHRGHDHGHESEAGSLNLHLEVTGSVGITGEEEGAVNAEGLIGFSYGLSSNVDLRIGYEFPLSSPREFDHGIVTGLIWHF